MIRQEGMARMGVTPDPDLGEAMTARIRRPRRFAGLRTFAGRRAKGPRSRARRRLGTAVRMLVALTFVGGFYAALAPGMQASAEDLGAQSAAAAEGKRLYETSCITCHGPNAQGVTDRGPSLIGSGEAAVEFQVGTGRMPLAQQGAQGERKEPLFTRDEARQIGAYIQELGGGPQMPPGDNLHEGADIARGGELYRVNCSACHSFGGNGGALSSGKNAPGLAQATDRDIYAAMLTGPQNMPVFGDNQLTPQEKRDIIAYVQTLTDDRDPGGWGMGRYGPVPEGLAIFLVGIVALVLATVWIVGKS
jgi:ubiquinol-cytochrome c reductase cytochrome c subunit